MKVILTGATGSIGAKTLQQCFSSPKITSLIVLSRRALIDGDKKEIAHPKLKVVIHEDFSSYPTSLLEREEFKGAKACIW
jgi:1-deoxy-D-xylulose 5-phosphate reductoisomerase